MEGKIIEPEIVLQLTDEQIRTVLPLTNRRAIKNSGMILGSVGLGGDTIALSFIPQKLAEQIIEIAARGLAAEGENKNVSS